MQCPRCSFENMDGKISCDRCGTNLRNFTFYSSEPEYNSSPSSEYGMQSQVMSYQKLSTHPRVTVLRVIRGILYFMAASIAALGFFGTSTAIFGMGQLSAGLALFFGLGLLVGSVVIFVHMRYRTAQLRLAQFIWSTLGATVGLFMAMILVYALAEYVNYNLSFSCVLLLYGLVMAAISLW
jgi:hypothetical protein